MADESELVHVRAVLSRDLDLVADLDEQRHLDDRAVRERGVLDAQRRVGHALGRGFLIRWYGVNQKNKEVPSESRMGHGRISVSTSDCATYHDRERHVLGHVGPDHVAVDDLQRQCHALDHKLQLTRREELRRDLGLRANDDQQPPDSCQRGPMRRTCSKLVLCMITRLLPSWYRNWKNWSGPRGALATDSAARKRRLILLPVLISLRSHCVHQST